MSIRELLARWALIGFIAGLAAALLNPDTRAHLTTGSGALTQGVINLLVGGIILAVVFTVIALLIRLTTGKSI